MIGAILTFCFLYVLIWLFERKDSDLDAFEIGSVVIIPIIVFVLIRVGGFFLGAGEWIVFLGLLAFVITTYLILNRLLEIPVRRSYDIHIGCIIF